MKSHDRGKGKVNSEKSIVRMRLYYKRGELYPHSMFAFVSMIK